MHRDAPVAPRISGRGGRRVAGGGAGRLRTGRTVRAARHQTLSALGLMISQSTQSQFW